jgi:hypothetical protein
MPVNSVKKLRKKMTMSDNMMIGYDDIYDCFTMEHFRLRQRMTLTTKTYCSRLYIGPNHPITAPNLKRLSLIILF